MITQSSSLEAARSSGVMDVRFAFDQLVPLVMLIPSPRFAASPIKSRESCTHSSDPHP